MKRTLRKRRTRRSGFTLMEVLLVLAILGVIAAMVVPQLLGQLSTAKKRTAELDIKSIERAVSLYTGENDDEFPENLKALFEPQPDEEGNRRKPYLDKILDPWDQPYNYEKPTDQGALRPRIWSNGPNRTNEQGAGDDINNWTDREKERQRSQ